MPKPEKPLLLNTWINLQNIIFSKYKLKGTTNLFFNVMKFLKDNNVKGDYLEFGVNQGWSFIRAYKIAQKIGLNMNFHAFDSFEGLPDPKTQQHFF